VSSWLRRETAEEGRLIREAWSLYRQDMWALIGGTIIAGITVSVTGGILIGIVTEFIVTGPSHVGNPLFYDAVGFALSAAVIVPLFGGLVAIVTRRVEDGSRGRAREVFKGFDQFGALVVAAVIWLGPSLTVVLVVRHFTTRAGVPLAVLEAALSWPFIYLLTVIVDQGLPFAQAVSSSLRLLAAGGIARTLVALVGLVPAVLLGAIPNTTAWTLPSLALAVLVLPLTLVYLVCMYFRARGEQDALDQATVRPDPPRATEKSLSVRQVGPGPPRSRRAGPHAR
jgi:hypothetical protein